MAAPVSVAQVKQKHDERYKALELTWPEEQLDWNVTADQKFQVITWYNPLQLFLL